jgi:hypothetical protein
MTCHAFFTLLKYINSLHVSLYNRYKKHFQFHNNKTRKITRKSGVYTMVIIWTICTGYSTVFFFLREIISDVFIVRMMYDCHNCE